MRTQTKTVQPTLLALALGLLLFAWATFGQHLDFPYYYHSDEPIKALQVETRTFNYHHPMLLLGTVNVLKKLVVPTTNEKGSLQALTELGRAVSAWFLVLGVLFLALVGYSRYRYAGFFIVAALLLNNPHLYEYGRFFKEDAALFFGIAAVLAALALWERYPRLTLPALLIAAGFGLVMSAKYIGILAVAVAVPAIICCPGPSPPSGATSSNAQSAGNWKPRALTAGWTLLLGAVIFALINIQLLSEPARWHSAFQREVSFLVRDSGQGFPFKTEFAEEITQSLPAPIFWFAGIYIVGFAARGLWRRPSQVVLLGFTTLYFLTLCCSERFSQQYLMPLSACLTVMAGMGAVFVYLQLLRFQAWARFVPVLLRSGRILQFGLIGVGAWLTFALYDLKAPITQSFTQDDRAALQTWIEENLPPDAVIVQDMETKLPAPDYRFIDTVPPVNPQKVLTIRDFEKLGIEGLRARGATHVAFTKKDYRKIKRLLKDIQKAQEAGLTQQQAWIDAAQKRPFWTRIARDATLLKFYEKGPAEVMQPGLWLYELPAEPPEPQM